MLPWLKVLYAFVFVHSIQILSLIEVEPTRAKVRNIVVKYYVAFVHIIGMECIKRS